MDIIPTSLDGVCGDLPPVVTLDAIGPAGGNVYEFDSGGSDAWIGDVFWSGTEWRANLPLGPLSPWAGANAPLYWNSGSLRWEGSFSTNCGDGYSCTLHYDLHFYPQMVSATTYRRGPIDQLTLAGTHVLRWYHDSFGLPGHTRMFGEGGQQLWEPDHQRGVTRRYGSSALPPDLSVGCRWAP